jgi:alkylated DNA repair dioxygenase AlkB
MSQQSLFDLEEQSADCEQIDIPDATLFFHPHAFNDVESTHHLQSLTGHTPWRHDEITVHGRTVPIPRLQAWYNNDNAGLTYSGMHLAALTWTDELDSIRQRVQQLSGFDFNGVLVNYYRDGNDSVGWHSDDETEFGIDPIIASVSFGATRDFVLKHKRDTKLKPVKCRLTSGSLLVMGKGVQTNWQHQLPKRKRVTEPRINLTFRNILPK